MRCADPAGLVRLLEQDPDVPGLRLLLDDDALTGWLADRLGASAVAVGARRTYLRWKPGAGGVARVRIGAAPGGPGGAGGADLFLAVWHRDAAAKLDKTVLRGGRAVVVADRDALAVLGRPAADRDLPGLGRLLQPGPDRGVRRLDPVDETARRRLRRAADGADQVTTLAWKPQRRWVGAIGPAPTGRVVLRAYRPRDVTAVVERYRAVARALGGGAPAVLGVNARRGQLAVEHLPGRRLDHLGGVESVRAERAAGALLARLHTAGYGSAGGAGHGAGGVGRLDLAAECDAVQAAARTADLLVPGAGAPDLAARLVEALRDLPRPEPVLLHGDLSADQVVVAPAGGVGLIDLDEVAVGAASYDLAGITAAWWLADPGTAGARVQNLLDGYREGRDGESQGGCGAAGPDPDELRVRTAAHLLRRAPETFRSGRADWPVQVAHAVRTAALTLSGEGGPEAGALDRAGVLR